MVDGHGVKYDVKNLSMSRQDAQVVNKWRWRSRAGGGGSWLSELLHCFFMPYLWEGHFMILPVSVEDSKRHMHSVHVW